MCTNTRLVTNKYTGKRVRVACGKCPACIQAKAVARTNRIRNHIKTDWISVFVTLTYSSEYVPYVIVDDLKSCSLEKSSLNVYRGISSPEIVTAISFSLDDIDVLGDISYFPYLTHCPGLMGVVIYDDVKRFIKRLRINLKRHYNYDYPLSYYACSEYGEQYYRPHFHLLLFCPKDSFDTLRDAVCESWSYADKSRTSRFVEISRDASSYVASYVNFPTSFPQVLRLSCFRPKHSYSKGFGVGLPCFSLNSILSKVREGNFHYTKYSFTEGVPSVTSVLIPQYVVNRYFPKFKGYSWIAPSSLVRLLRLPFYLRCELLQYEGLDWCDDDFHRMFVRLRHAIDYYIFVTGNTEYDYCIDYVATWTCFSSTVLRDSLTCIDVDWSDFYENANELSFRPEMSPTLSDIHEFTQDANKRSDIVRKTARLTDVYYKKDKTRRVVGKALTEMGLL